MIKKNTFIYYGIIASLIKAEGLYATESSDPKNLPVSFPSDFPTTEALSHHFEEMMIVDREDDLSHSSTPANSPLLCSKKRYLKECGTFEISNEKSDEISKHLKKILTPESKKEEDSSVFQYLRKLQNDLRVLNPSYFTDENDIENLWIDSIKALNVEPNETETLYQWLQFYLNPSDVSSDQDLPPPFNNQETRKLFESKEIKKFLKTTDSMNPISLKSLLEFFLEKQKTSSEPAKPLIGKRASMDYSWGGAPSSHKMIPQSITLSSPLLEKKSPIFSTFSEESEKKPYLGKRASLNNCWYGSPSSHKLISQYITPSSPSHKFLLRDSGDESQGSKTTTPLPSPSLLEKSSTSLIFSKESEKKPYLGKRASVDYSWNGAPSSHRLPPEKSIPLSSPLYRFTARASDMPSLSLDPTLSSLEEEPTQ
jgi:hypothetical protein